MDSGENVAPSQLADLLTDILLEIRKSNELLEGLSYKLEESNDRLTGIEQELQTVAAQLGVIAGNTTEIAVNTIS